MDPTARQAFLDEMNSAMYLKPTRALDRDYTDLIRANSRLNDNDQQVMVFRGKMFVTPHHKGKYPKLPNVIDKSLRPRLKILLEEEANLGEERDLATGYIKIIMRETSNAVNWYSLIPDSLHSILRKHDRHFLPEKDEVPWSEEQTSAFLAVNRKYRDMMLSRMTLNLLIT